jgi:hypothetical protein
LITLPHALSLPHGRNTSFSQYFSISKFKKDLSANEGEPRNPKRGKETRTKIEKFIKEMMLETRTKIEKFIKEMMLETKRSNIFS